VCGGRLIVEELVEYDDLRDAIVAIDDVITALERFGGER